MYTEDDYLRHIKLLAWKLLMEANICELPVRITTIAKTYNMQNLIDYSETRWDNTKILSSSTLDKFGLNYSSLARKELAVRVLVPLCVLRKCNIRFPEDIVRLTDIPYSESLNRMKRLSDTAHHASVHTYEQETIILRNFQSFIDRYNSSRKNLI